MRILQVVHRYPPESLAGVEVYTKSLSDNLAQDGHNVFVFTGDPSKDGGSEEKNDGPVIVHRVYTGQIDSPSFDKSYTNESVEWEFAQFVDTIRPDIVHIQHCYQLSIKIMEILAHKRIPFVVTLHDYWYCCPTITFLRSDNSWCRHRGGDECYFSYLEYNPVTITGSGSASRYLKRLKRVTPRIIKRTIRKGISVASKYASRSKAKKLVRKRRTIMQNALSGAAAIFSPSNFMREVYGRQEVVPKERIQVIPHGIKGLTKHQRHTNEVVQFGYIGTFILHKGLDLLVRAFNAVPPESAKLHIYSDYSRNPQYARDVKRAAQNPSIFFKGGYQNDQLSSILSELDAIIVPSLCWENSPMTILEAFTAGVPVITANAGGAKELTERYGGGILFNFRDQEDLSRTLIRIIKQREILDNARRSIKSIPTIQEHGKRIIDEYSAILSK